MILFVNLLAALLVFFGQTIQGNNQLFTPYLPSKAEGRQQQSLLNDFVTWAGRNPLQALIANNRSPAIRNPDTTTSLRANYDSCVSADNGLQTGVCLPSSSCSLQGGRSSGSCRLGAVCCVITVEKCSGIITLNNTQWQSPSAGVPASTSTTCSVTVRLDQSLTEQNSFSICQIRLDFQQFTIAQPTIGVCATDKFKVSGANNQPPVICGDNDSQHMYVHVAPSGEQRTDVQLAFSFGIGGENLRSWSIKIAMIPCGASYSAPASCLQYFTGNSGKVKTFNWKENSNTVRELVNQAYSVCFRNEIIDGQRANNICYQPCQVSGLSFLLSGSASDSAVPSTDESCVTDYVVVAGVLMMPTSQMSIDRLCGGFSSIPLYLCSSVQPFTIFVNTDASEPASDVNNLGFCADYMQRVSNNLARPFSSGARSITVELSDNRVFRTTY